jgi:hypothetical protein
LRRLRNLLLKRSLLDGDNRISNASAFYRKLGT